MNCKYYNSESISVLQYLQYFRFTVSISAVKLFKYKLTNMLIL